MGSNLAHSLGVRSASEGSADYDLHLCQMRLDRAVWMLQSGLDLSVRSMCSRQGLLACRCRNEGFVIPQ